MFKIQWDALYALCCVGAQNGSGRIKKLFTIAQGALRLLPAHVIYLYSKQGVSEEYDSKNTN